MDPVHFSGFFDAWGAWMSGRSVTADYLWGYKILYLGRAAKLLIWLGSLLFIADMVGHRRLRLFVTYARQRGGWTFTGHFRQLRHKFRAAEQTGASRLRYVLHTFRTIGLSLLPLFAFCSLIAITLLYFSPDARLYQRGERHWTQDLFGEWVRAWPFAMTCAYFLIAGWTTIICVVFIVAFMIHVGLELVALLFHFSTSRRVTRYFTGLSLVVGGVFDLLAS